MKKNYLLVALFLSLFSLNSSAKSAVILKVVVQKMDTRLLINSKSNLILAAPTSNPKASSTALCEGETLTLTANPSGGIAPYTFSWTGPNGYVSTDENPVITNIGLSESGIYSLVVTDALNAISTIKSTEPIVVSTKKDPEFDATLPAICKGGFAPILSSTSTNGITGTWNPAIVNNSTTTTYIFTPDPGQCANSLIFTIFVLNNVVPKFTLPPSICSGDTPPILPTVSNNGIVGTWNPSIVNNTASGSYVFTPSAGQCATVTTVNIAINPLQPVFIPAIQTICSGETTSPLPTTSTNGITGTWSPAFNNTTTSTYTFTPNAGQCAPTTATATMTVIINPITAIFTQVAPICSGAVLAPMPTKSTNGVTGTWSPVMNNLATTTYTFTPTAGQCTVTPVTMTIVVNPITAVFSAVAPICSGAVLAPLPTTSPNGVTGTWSPAMNNLTTTTYTFTPTAGQCTVTPVTMTIVVNPIITPTFTAIAPICSGSASPILPTTSNNLITGTWSPTTVSNIASATYTFTPNASQCALTTTLDVTITPKTIPIFDPIADVCYGSVAPNLPTTSVNGIAGTWNPATISNTNSTIYTFTPSVGICATTTILSINVNTITPIFNVIAPICTNTVAPILPVASANGITGTWNPTTVSNTASGTYTFTPDAGQCAIATNINITVNPIITAIFTPIAPICSGSASPVLPLTSNNSIAGSWNPATVSNTTSGTYTFLPTAGQCATGTTLNVTVNPTVTPTFTAIAPICSGSTSPVLSTTSTNLVTGTWNPITVSNTTSGTYTFTPNAGQCALSTTMSITVYQSPTGFTVKTTDVVNDTPNGIIEISNPIGGLAPYQYSINTSSFTTNTTFTNLSPGNYTIIIQDKNGCQFSKMTTINSICVFPNAITPNGDTFNDTLNLNGCDVVKLELFNRYGRKVNSYTNYTDQWGGTNEKGESLPNGTYFYVAEIKGGISKSGWVFIAE